jgi:putative peptidoglycan lipid II flippase
MLKSSGAMAAATMISRVLGMVREMIYAGFMGDSPVAGAFKFAFQIPNLFRRLLGEGALSVAFIPIFKEKEKTAGETQMWHAANAVISGLVVLAAVIIGLVLLGISLALAWSDLAPGTRLMLELLRIMFPYMLLVCVAAIFMGMLNARGQFFIPAMGATILNVVMIASVLWLAPRFGERLDTQIFGLAVGVLLAGVAQAAFQFPNLFREGFRYRWVTPWRNETVRLVGRRMLPGLIGVAAFQINVVFTSLIAFQVSETIVASFDYAVRLMELPQGIFGVSLATFLLPTLAGLAAEKKYPEFRASISEALGYLMFVNLIASALLIALAEPIVRLLFERGAFGIDATQRASWALICLAPGLIAFSSVNVLARAFYALGDTKTPMKISAACLALNLLLVLFLVWPLRHSEEMLGDRILRALIFMGLANTLSSSINAGLLLFSLRKKLGKLDLTSLHRAFVSCLAAAVFAGIVAWWFSRWMLQTLGRDTLLAQMLPVFAPIFAAGVIYWALSLWLDIPAARAFSRLLLKTRKDPE